jgi:hypothetical protein
VIWCAVVTEGSGPGFVADKQGVCVSITRHTEGLITIIDSICIKKSQPGKVVHLDTMFKWFREKHRVVLADGDLFLSYQVWDGREFGRSEGGKSGGKHASAVGTSVNAFKAYTYSHLLICISVRYPGQLIAHCITLSYSAIMANRH